MLDLIAGAVGIRGIQRYPGSGQLLAVGSLVIADDQIGIDRQRRLGGYQCPTGAGVAGLQGRNRSELVGEARDQPFRATGVARSGDDPVEQVECV